MPVTLFSLVQMTSDLVQRHVLWSYRSYQNLGQVDHRQVDHNYQNLGQVNHNLHNHVFDDVICKPPVGQVDHNLHNHVFDDVICKPPGGIDI